MVSETWPKKVESLERTKAGAPLKDARIIP